MKSNKNKGWYFLVTLMSTTAAPPLAVSPFEGRGRTSSSSLARFRSASSLYCFIFLPFPSEEAIDVLPKFVFFNSSRSILATQLAPQTRATRDFELGSKLTPREGSRMSVKVLYFEEERGSAQGWNRREVRP